MIREWTTIDELREYTKKCAEEDRNVELESVLDAVNLAAYRGEWCISRIALTYNETADLLAEMGFAVTLTDERWNEYNISWLVEGDESNGETQEE